MAFKLGLILVSPEIFCSMLIRLILAFTQGYRGLRSSFSHKFPSQSGWKLVLYAFAVCLVYEPQTHVISCIGSDVILFMRLLVTLTWTSVQTFLNLISFELGIMTDITELCRLMSVWMTFAQGVGITLKSDLVCSFLGAKFCDQSRKKIGMLFKHVCLLKLMVV